MHQSQTSGGDSWFPLRMGYTGTTHGGRAVNRAPGRQFMADEHSAGNEHTEPAAPADRPGAPSSPWEPAGPVGPGAPSPWAPAPTSPWAAPPPPPPPTPAPEPPSPPPAAAPVEAPGPAESWDNPLSGPDAWVNPLAAEGAEETISGAPPPGGDTPPPLPPPAWQIGPPGAVVWGEPTVAAPARRAAGTRPFLLAAATGAVVGALVAGLVVAAVKDDKKAAPGRPLAFSANTSKIARTGDIQEILAKVEPAVVSIRTRTLSLGDFLKPVPGEGAGTGFVIGSDGVIVTNNHVVAGAQSIEVVFADDRKMPARVLGRDPTTDLAVMKVDATDLPTAALGDSDALKVGDDV